MQYPSGAASLPKVRASMRIGRGEPRGYHDYISEMRAALEACSDYVERLVEKQGAALLR
jgi:hypothetical protein